MKSLSHIALTVLLTSFIGAMPASADQKTAATGLDEIMSIIGDLESQRDPKCLATASRLEDFMYGTPLTESARTKKVDLQKKLILDVWQLASAEAESKTNRSVSSEILNGVLEEYFIISEKPSGDVSYKTRGGDEIELKFDDIRQYSSIAYALRAILSVQQDLKNSPEKFLPLEKDAIDTLKKLLDIITLAVLQDADKTARLNNRFKIEGDDFEQSWGRLLQTNLAGDDRSYNQRVTSEGSSDLSTIKRIIKEKIKSYEAYNNISIPVFMRNIQVYFARHRWPGDPEQSLQLKQSYNEILISFVREMYIESQNIAKQQNHNYIRYSDVSDVIRRILPHKINEYEDAIFFPTLTPEKQIYVESYDMDAFRDSGLHWQYLGSAIDDLGAQATIEPDPFAAEILVENIAQFGVLLLRQAGLEAQRIGDEYLNSKHVISALNNLKVLIEESHMTGSNNDISLSIQSADSNADIESKGLHFFSDITGQSGIKFRHSSADWLNRLIRSYTVRNKEIAVLAVPPAFGGAGVAAEDIDNDGLPDVLLLGGRGNRLFKNTGNGTFKDITELSGISWIRPEDSKPGEPRQPIIADFDNDGLSDILITYVNDAHRLYKNIGDGKFKDVTDSAGFGGKGLVAGPAVAADFDNDGLLDVYIGYFGQYIEGIKPTLARKNFNGLPNQLFKNLGDFKFQNITEGSGVDNRGWTQALAHTDLNRDGLQDLIVGNDFGINAYYLNKGNSKFDNISSALGVDKPSYTMNVGLSDLNNDLYPDVYISNIVTMDKDQKYVLPGDNVPMQFDAQKMAKMRVVESNDFFISGTKKGDLDSYINYSEIMGRGASTTGWSWGAIFFDVDNDSDDDLYVVNGMNDYALYSTENPYYEDPTGKARNVVLPQSNKESNVFFINSDGKFHNVSERSGANLLGNSRAVVSFDIDHDGDLDMVVNNYHDSAVVYKNNAEQLNNNWITVKLIGDPTQKTNRDAIGARVIVNTDKGKRIWREIRRGESYLSVLPKEQHFGLGKTDKVNMKIEWPNGHETEFNDLDIGYRYIIDQKTMSIGRVN